MICNMQSTQRKPKWKKTTIPVNSTWRYLCYNDMAGVFVATDYLVPSQCIYSYDGIHWNKITDYVSAGLSTDKLFLWRGMFTSGCRSWSENGKEWRKTNLPAGVQSYHQILGNGKIVSIDGDDTHSCAVSIDGINWTKATFPKCRIGMNTYFNGKFLAFALDQNAFWYSDDGLSWRASEVLPESSFLLNSACSPDRIVAVSETMHHNGASTNPGGFYSNDGISWIRTKLPCDCARGVIYAFDKFHIISETGEMYSSEDCLNWSQAKGLFGDTWGPLHHEQGKLFYFCRNDMYYTSDGETWRKCELPIDNGRLNFVACGKGRIVMLNYSGKAGRGVCWCGRGVTAMCGT